MSNGLSMRNWLKGAHVSGVREGSPADAGGMGPKRAKMAGNALGLV